MIYKICSVRSLGGVDFLEDASEFIESDNRLVECNTEVVVVQILLKNRKIRVQLKTVFCIGMVTRKLIQK